MDIPSPEVESIAGTVLNIPANDDNAECLTPKLPRRLRRRLSESKSPTISSQEIDAKLRSAHLRRQKYHESLSSKARIGFLEAQKVKACATSLQVQQVTCSVNSKRESEKASEGCSQLAESFIAEELRKKGILHNLGQPSSQMVKQEPINKLISCWRMFVRLKGTTYSLAKAFWELQINQKSVKSMPFEKLSLMLGSGGTIRIVKYLLHRIESHIIIRCETNGNSGVLHMDNIDHLLKHVAIRGRKVDGIRTSSSIRSKKAESRRGASQKSAKLCRYPACFVLGAYLVSGHPNEVSWGMGDYGIDLVKAAEVFSQEFESLIKIMLQRHIHSSEKPCVPTASRSTFSAQLENFDKAWCSYLYHFVTWKEKDAKLLGNKLVRDASRLEVSRMHNYKLTLEGYCAEITHMESVLDQMKVQQMSGNDGIEDIGGVLTCKSTDFTDTVGLGTPSTSLPVHVSSPRPASSLTVSLSYDSSKGDIATQRQSNASPVVQSTSKQEKRNIKSEIGNASPGNKTNGHQSSDQMLVTENAVIVNELVHGRYSGSADFLLATDEDQGSIKSIMRDTMDKAFWDGVAETLKQDIPDYSWVLKLIKELRDELCQLSPSSWRQEIDQAIDLEILSQVLQSGPLDIEYCGRILEFSLVTLQKLSASAKEDELRTAHQNLLRELAEISQVGEQSAASFALIVMRGLRFILKNIQALKNEVSKARIRMLEPLIKGPAGFEYLKSSFENLYGCPPDAPTRLAMVRRWLSAVLIEMERNWDEHQELLLVIKSMDGEHSKQHSPTTLRAGSAVVRVPTLNATSSVAAGVEQPECKGEKLDLLLRLGLLKLVNEVEGLTAERLPETFQLNLLRLRNIQSQLQKIIVISTSILILRQTLISEHLLTSALDMENVISDCVKQLSQLLDTVEDVGVTDIVDIMKCYPNSEEDPEKSRARKDIMSNMLGKSLSAGDAVFSRVSCSLYLAARGIVLGGTGAQGTQLAKTALKRIGAAPLAQKLVDAVGELVVMANVSKSVHKAWYEPVLGSI